jgi:hypothetical protein
MFSLCSELSVTITNCRAYIIHFLVTMETLGIISEIIYHLNYPQVPFLRFIITSFYSVSVSLACTCKQQSKDHRFLLCRCTFGTFFFNFNSEPSFLSANLALISHVKSKEQSSVTAQEFSQQNKGKASSQRYVHPSLRNWSIRTIFTSLTKLLFITNTEKVSTDRTLTCGRT